MSSDEEEVHQREGSDDEEDEDRINRKRKRDHVVKSKAFIDDDDDDDDDEDDRRSTKSAASSRSKGSRRPSASSNNNKKKKRRSYDDEEEEEEDEDEEDDEEDDEEYSRKRAKKRKSGVGGFILEEAEVDDEVEEEDEWEEGAEQYIHGNEMDEHGPTAREIEGSLRRHSIWDSQKEEELEKYLRQKYADEATAQRHFGDGGEDMSDEITQQTFLPGIKDPSLWMVKCRLGEEKYTVLQLMRKAIAYANNNEPLQIKSVIAPEGIKGYVYIEAFKQTHVKNAIEGISNLKMGLYKQQMVPITEMTDVLRVTKEQTGLKPKQWVRLKRGVFKDDLAQVDYVDLAQNQVHLKLLPRIDYTRMRGAMRSDSDSPNKKGFQKNQQANQRKRRPPAKPFNPDEVRKIGGEITSDGDFLLFESNRYSHKGFLYKTFQLNAILAEGVTPSLAELEKFGEVPVEGVLESGAAVTTPGSKSEVTHNFATGDNVEVCDGELQHLQGKITAIDGNKITVQPKHEDLKDPLDFQAAELKKFFAIGDHVRVIGGKYEGDTGLIVRVDIHCVFLFSDLTMHELKVLPKDLQLCADMASGVDSMGNFQWGDLVQIDPQNVGVIVRLEKELFHVLTQMGKVVEKKPQAIHKKRESKFVVGIDSRGNSIQKRDIVNVVDGVHVPDRQGEIRHIYKNYAFLYSRMCLENGGIFVCKTNHLELAGGGTNTRTDGGSKPGAGYMSPRLSSPMHPSSGGGGGGSGGNAGAGGGPNAASTSTPQNILSGGRSPLGPGRTNVTPGMPTSQRRNRDLIGQTIKITQGHYKGSIGIVKDATDTTARVELHSSCQTISVDCNRIQVIGGAGGKTGNVTTYSRTPGYSAGGSSATPMYRVGDGGRTPMHDGSRTPHYGAGNQTPMQDGSRTPAWDPTVTNTPARDDSEYYDTSYNPATPGYSHTPYTPQTPGGYAASEHSSNYSPYNASPANEARERGSERGSERDRASHRDDPSSPGGYGMLHSVPSPGGYAPSPLNYNSPMTPSGAGRGNPSADVYGHPQTPGAGLDPYSSLGGPSSVASATSSVMHGSMVSHQSHGYNTEWQTTGIEVTIKESHPEPGLRRQNGVIRNVLVGTCAVFLVQEERTVNVQSDQLVAIIPKTGDRVKVIAGELREAFGYLKSVDGSDGVVDIHGDIKFFPLSFLARLVEY
ncbi:unnamed protein product [Orchesella dallaii]|uniref:Transcription elongation factor SPT5 n=1 Tax=Orchesella dallaii TaxID=48710 RepID=A0ABP1QNI6_9HEXA